MKKNLAIELGIYVVILLVISVVNNVMLLSSHDLAFYYTWDGIVLATKLAIVELPISILVTKIASYFVTYNDENKEETDVLCQKEEP